MEGLIGEDSFGLNIVAQPLESVKKATKGKSKKRNKYERRRRKSQLGKDLQNKITEIDPISPHQAQKDDTKRVVKADSARVPDDELEPNRLNNEAETDSVDDEGDSTTHSKESADNQGAMSERDALPDNDEERAKYLAEFHARPMELDRRAGAVLRKVSKSKDSEHLFSLAMEWEDFPLHNRILSAVKSHQFFKLEKPTVIQSKAISAFFRDDQLHNVLLQSETGSGKTLGYFLPIIQSLAVDSQGELRKVDRSQAGTRCLILCPTRELAAQTLNVAERLCSSSFNWLVPGCLFGEERRKSEKARIRKGLSIVVATPGRLLDHLMRTESLLMALKGKLEWLVLDEVDRLLDMGLGEQVKQIVQRIRANQPGSGRDGITWRSVLVSATVSSSVEKLAKEVLLGGDGSWVWVKGGTDVAAETAADLVDSTPRQLSQLSITVSAKLRLPTLVAFLVQRAEKGERVVVFMSTCAAVDYYHALFAAVDSILEGAESDSGKGIFGSRCPIYKLHGNVPHGERQLVLRKFMNKSSISYNEKKQGALLLATDVAARGLNLPDCDWTVQYDPPSEVADYVHRAGRVARAGRAGHSLLFLLPSERPFLDVLKQRGVKKLSALSLASTLNAAGDICKSLTQEGVNRSGGGLGQSKSSASRLGEAFSTEIQRRLEDCVLQDDARAKAQAKGTRDAKSKKSREMGAKPQAVSGVLLELARKAFLSHIRAYPTKEKLVRHIFVARALHFGHVARSFALKEAPKKLSSGSKKTPLPQESRKRNMAMAFELLEDETGDNRDAPTPSRSKRTKKGEGTAKSNDRKGAKSLLMANAAKLQTNGLDSL